MRISHDIHLPIEGHLPVRASNSNSFSQPSDAGASGVPRWRAAEPSAEWRMEVWGKDVWMGLHGQGCVGKGLLADVVDYQCKHTLGRAPPKGRPLLRRHRALRSHRPAQARGNGCIGS